MSCVHLERAVLRPEIYRVCDASAPPLIHHLGRLGARDVELQIGILLPVSEEERELEEESVVGIAKHGKRLRARIPRQPTLERFACPDELLVGVEVVRIRFLVASIGVSVLCHRQRAPDALRNPTDGRRHVQLRRPAS